MPNNTANKIQFRFYGDNGEKLNKIEEFLKSNDRELDFNNIIPLKGSSPNEAWGTKWNAYSINKIRSDESSLTYLFDTAWVYPQPIIDSLLDKFPDVYFTFCSACEGGWFALQISRDDEGGEIRRVEFNDGSGNDPGGHIRSAMLAALDM